MAYNVQFKKVFTLPANPDNHVFYAVYEQLSDGSKGNLKAFYLGSIELSDVALSAVVNTLRNEFDAEVTRATRVEGEISEALAAEVTRATAAEGANATAIAENKAAIEAEVSRAKAAEEANTKKINDDIQALKDNIGDLSNIMNFAGAFEQLPSPTDTFEVGDVIIITSGDNAGKEYVLDEAKGWVEIGHASATDAKLAELAETVKTLRDEFDAEVLRAKAAEEANASAIAVEKARAEGAEANLDAAIKKEAEDARAAETKLAGDLAAETQRAKGKEAELAQSISDENTRALSAEAKLGEDLAAEAKRATDEEARIEKKLDDAVLKLYGSANQDSVDLGKLVGAINQLVDSTKTNEDTLNGVSTSIADIETRVAKTETLLTWEE